MNYSETVPTEQAIRLENSLEAVLDTQDISVPMLPEVANKVVQLAQDPEAEVTELANLIQGDQTLASYIMKVTNSAAYNPTGKIISLQQAITRLGMRTITDIALAASISAQLFKAPGFESHIQHLFKYSLATALWSKELARYCRKNVEAAFLAGLLHNIGQAASIHLLFELSSQNSLSAEALEKPIVLQAANKYQQALGSRITELWDMPQSVRDVVTHFDMLGPETPNRNLTLIIMGGAQIAGNFFTASPNTEMIKHEDLQNSSTLAELCLYEDDIEKLLQKEEDVNTAFEAMSA